MLKSTIMDPSVTVLTFTRPFCISKLFLSLQSGLPLASIYVFASLLNGGFPQKSERAILRWKRMMNEVGICATRFPKTLPEISAKGRLMTIRARTCLKRTSGDTKRLLLLPGAPEGATQLELQPCQLSWSKPRKEACWRCSGVNSSHRDCSAVVPIMPCFAHSTGLWPSSIQARCCDNFSAPQGPLKRSWMNAKRSKHLEPGQSSQVSWV
mmetsp:Transcript_122846/g.238923  ORF Transcript_122846/g.238923 Transcript_122846/m.238923 type:complete len:210 (-) Transcript_122846:350-979(-)